jgi:Trypsin-like peptidase domain
MLKPYQPPTGKINTKRRSFEEVVRDLRFAVFCVIRNRQVGENQVRATALGSGFFVSPEIFLTCNHVINSAGNAHQDGDLYQLVCSRDAAGGIGYTVPNATQNQNLHLFPDADLAFLTVEGTREQSFVALEYGTWPVGKEIGVAGYPLPRLLNVEGQLRYDGLVFRVAKGVIASTYPTELRPEGVPPIQAQVVEVNFLFVPGNSGGPVFDAETGRVGAFVHGFTSTKIRERVEQITAPLQLPPALTNFYIENLNAIYSLAIKMERAREYLERFGVRL